MFSFLKSNLARRILLLVLVSILLMLIAFIFSGWLAISQTSQRVWQERQAFVQAVSRYLDYILAENLKWLENFRFASGVNLEDNNLEPEKSALHEIYINSIFDDGVFLTDRNGSLVWIEPISINYLGANVSDFQPVSQTLATGRTIVSGLSSYEFMGKKTMVVITPVHNQEGRIAGLVGGRISPQGKILRDVTNLVTLGNSSYIDIIDNQGNILASSSGVITSGEVLLDNRAEVNIRATLSYAPWTVAVRQPGAMANAPVREMELRLIIFGGLSILVVLVLSWGMARSILQPLAQLKNAAQTISRGDLSKPVPQLSNDEIGQLGSSFDSMRIALRKSLQEIRLLNLDLESKVRQRTRQLEDSYREIEHKETARGELLRKLFSAQEEERKRIARELHDETSQSLNGLVMRLEAALALPDDSTPKIKEILKDTRTLAVHTIDNVHKIMFDLRPAVLDDLGIISAIRWYAQNRLKDNGVSVRIEVTGEEKKLPAPVENAIFRVMQEAITNIIRHAEAQNVLLSVEYFEKAVNIEIVDDGKGFFLKRFNPQSDEIQGLGLVGMRERVTLVGGELEIESQPGRGTRINITIPF